MDTDTYTAADLGSALHDALLHVLPYVGGAIALALPVMIILVGIKKAIEIARNIITNVRNGEVDYEAAARERDA